MGDEITQPAQSAGFVRAKYLREALRRGSAPALNSGDALIPDWHSSFDQSDPIVQKAYLDQLVECAPEAVTILDPSQHITRINSEFTRMFGFSSEEALGQPLDPLVVPSDRMAESQWIQETVEKGQKVTLESKRRRKDGTLLDVAISCAPVRVDSKQVGSCVLYRDIDEHKQA